MIESGVGSDSNISQIGFPVFLLWNWNSTEAKPHHCYWAGQEGVIARAATKSAGASRPART
jgi:hypothetical protein